MSIREKLKSLNLDLPVAAKPLAAYVPAVKTGKLVFTAGQLPLVDGKIPYAGKVGKDSDVPLWVVLSAHTAIGLGTMFGGWKIVKTMGNKLTRLQPMGGVAAETAAAITLFFTSWKGIPVSTTHTITGAIVGVGTTRRLSAVRWGVARRVVWAWVLTIPGSAAVAAGCYFLVEVLQ